MRPSWSKPQNQFSPHFQRHSLSVRPGRTSMHTFTTEGWRASPLSPPSNPHRSHTRAVWGGGTTFHGVSEVEEHHVGDEE